ncbi:MAG: rod shape-determining protein MreD [Endomicrobiia bacterium]|nr:rod shape-determining protein MreD [Endomicrobiia bacterium]
MKNKFIIYAVAYAGLIALSGFFAIYMKFLGASPEFFLIFLAAASLGEGPRFGAAFGFVSGIFADFVSVFLPGSQCLIYTTVGYLCGILSGKFYVNSAQNRILVTLSATVFVRAALWLAAETFGMRYSPSFRSIALTAIYNVASSPFIFAAAALAVRLAPRRHGKAGPGHG